MQLFSTFRTLSFLVNIFQTASTTIRLVQWLNHDGPGTSLHIFPSHTLTFSSCPGRGLTIVFFPSLPDLLFPSANFILWLTTLQNFVHLSFAVSFIIFFHYFRRLTYSSLGSCPQSLLRWGIFLSSLQFNWVLSLSWLSLAFDLLTPQNSWLIQLCIIFPTRSSGLIPPSSSNVRNALVLDG